MSRKRWQRFKERFPFVKCNPGTPRCLSHRACCRGHLLTVLRYTDALFREHGITYWLDYGTLLGAVREKRLIPYDTDVDLGILERDKEKLKGLAGRIAADGHALTKDSVLDFYRIQLSGKNTLHADVFIWLEKDGMLYREGYMPKDADKGRDFPVDRVAALDSAEIAGGRYPVPSEPADFCAFRFGPGWMVPQREDG